MRRREPRDQGVGGSRLVLRVSRRRQEFPLFGRAEKRAVLESRGAVKGRALDASYWHCPR